MKSKKPTQPLKKFESKVLPLLNELQNVAAELNSAEFEAISDVVRELNRIRSLSDPKEQAQIIDEMMFQEIQMLLAKLAMAKKHGSTPSPEVMWSFLQEIITLLLKLVAKAYLLQGMKPPPLDPGFGPT